MPMSEAEKKESHRLACAKYYKKKRAILRNQSKLRMRRLRALRKSAKLTQDCPQNEEDRATIPHEGTLNTRLQSPAPDPSHDITLEDDEDDPEDDSESDISSKSRSSSPTSGMDERDHDDSTFDGVPLAELRAQRAERMKSYLSDRDTMADTLDEWYRKDREQQGLEIEEDDDNVSLPVASDSEEM
ncbi:hypothetical protein BJ912DRAFT_925172 [Pholiota molesta]|nr:hypothetical protein BJ912DRAFT_925172 [Pholiota molesta]